MADLKETLISSMRNGEETLKELYYARKMGDDFTLQKGRVDEIVNKYHRDKIIVKVSDIIQRSPICKTYKLIPVYDKDLPIFQAGQFINLFINIDNKITTSRPYSISSSPLERGYYEVTVQKVKDGFVSQYIVNNLKIGDELKITSPAGQFFYSPVFQDKHTVLIAGGSGITPFISMIREIINKNNDRIIDLIYGIRNLDNALFYDELNYISSKYKNIRCHYVVSEPLSESDKKYHQGFITKDLISNLINDIDIPTYFISGPKIMSDFVISELKNLGVKDKNIIPEKYGSTIDVTLEKNYPKEFSGKEIFKIKFKDFEFDARANETIVQAFERAGLHDKINVVCRVGSCSLCRAKLLKGKVFVPEDVLIRSTDKKYGYIHSCKTYPLSDLEIDL